MCSDLEESLRISHNHLLGSGSFSRARGMMSEHPQSRESIESSKRIGENPQQNRLTSSDRMGMVGGEVGEVGEVGGRGTEKKEKKKRKKTDK